MKTPRHPPGAAFDEARNAIEAWRLQQIAALDETQRRLYEEARRKAEEREKAKAAELEKRKLAEAQERMSRKMLENRRAQLLPPGVRLTSLTEAIARRIAETYFQTGRLPDEALLRSLADRAARQAVAEVERAHARELALLRARESRRTDDLLRSFKRARETQPARRGAFARSAVAGKGKVDFSKAATGDGESRDPHRSEVIGRALARVKEKENREQQRGDRGKGRARGE